MRGKQFFLNYHCLSLLLIRSPKKYRSPVSNPCHSFSFCIPETYIFRQCTHDEVMLNSPRKAMNIGPKIKEQKTYHCSIGYIIWLYQYNWKNAYISVQLITIILMFVSYGSPQESKNILIYVFMFCMLNCSQ